MSGEWPLQASVPGRNAGAVKCGTHSQPGIEGLRYYCGTGTSRYRSTGWSKGMFTTPVSYYWGLCAPALQSTTCLVRARSSPSMTPCLDGPTVRRASYNGSGLSFKSPHSRSSPGPCRAAVVCSLGVGPRGPRASGHRIRMYAGPVSWVSNCYHGFHGGTVRVVYMYS